MPRLLLVLLLAGAVRADDAELKARAEAQCAELTRAIEAYLGRKFNATVPVQLVDREFIGDFALALERRVAPGGLAEIARQLAVRLHQVPPDYDLEKEQLELVKASVAGLYDPDKDCLYVVTGAGAPGTPIFTITAAHELIHAYRDVDKDSWARTLASVHTDADWAIAMTCVVEGDATLLGQAIGMASIQGAAPDAFVKRTADMARQMPAGTLGGVPGMDRFPLALREMFIRRYEMGLVLMSRVFGRGGLEALAAAYDTPPRSTEQVLHPEKYLDEPFDEPMVFAGGDPTAALGEGWTLALANVMGEFEMQIQLVPLLGRERAERAAAGWDGARFHFCRKEGLPAFFGLVSTWDSEQDAEEFAAAWADWATRRDGEERTCSVDGGLRTVRTAEGLVAVERRGCDVLVADGVPGDRVAAVLAALSSATRSERARDATPLADR